MSGEDKKGLIVIGIPKGLEFGMDLDGLQRMGRDFEIVLISDAMNVTLASGRDDTLLESQYVRSMALPDAYRKVVRENQFALNHSIAVNVGLSAVQAAHTAGMRSIWMCGNDDDKSSEAYLYVGFKALNQKPRPVIEIVQEVSAKWAPKRPGWGPDGSAGTHLIQ